MSRTWHPSAAAEPSTEHCLSFTATKLSAPTRTRMWRHSAATPAEELGGGPKNRLRGDIDGTKDDTDPLKGVVYYVDERVDARRFRFLAPEALQKELKDNLAVAALLLQVGALPLLLLLR